METIDVYWVKSADKERNTWIIFKVAAREILLQLKLFRRDVRIVQLLSDSV